MIIEQFLINKEIYYYEYIPKFLNSGPEAIKVCDQKLVNIRIIRLSSTREGYTQFTCIEVGNKWETYWDLKNIINAIKKFPDLNSELLNELIKLYPEEII